MERHCPFFEYVKGISSWRHAQTKSTPAFGHLVRMPHRRLAAAAVPVPRFATCLRLAFVPPVGRTVRVDHRPSPRSCSWQELRPEIRWVNFSFLLIVRGHQEKGSACWGSLFCMLTCKMTVLPLNMVASTVSDAKLHVVTLCMLTCIRDVMHVNMHCCVCQHA